MTAGTGWTGRLLEAAGARWRAFVRWLSRWTHPGLMRYLVLLRTVLLALLCTLGIAYLISKGDQDIAALKASVAYTARLTVVDDLADAPQRQRLHVFDLAMCENHGVIPYPGNMLLEPDKDTARRKALMGIQAPRLPSSVVVTCLPELERFRRLRIFEPPSVSLCGLY